MGAHQPHGHFHCINGPINGTQKIGEYVTDLTNGKTDLRNNK